MPKPQPDSPPRPEKIFPVSWDQFHRDSRALAWRLHEAGPFEAIVAITRGGLVPAAIVARELNVRLIETVCVASYQDYKNQGELTVLKGIAPVVTAMRAQGKGVLIVDDLVDTGKTARVVRDLLPPAAAAGMAYPMGARADYADRPIHIIVGYAAGGGVDISARLLSEPMKATLGQSIIVENRTGASAMIASNTVAKAAPDGYTLLMAASGEVAINQFLFKDKMIYDASRELTPVALVGIVPCVVVVATTTPVHNPQELIAYAKANAGKLSFSSSGVGNPQQLAGELMNSMAGINVLHVPYRGSAPAVTDVATGAVT